MIYHRNRVFPKIQFLNIIGDISHLKSILGLSDKTADEIYNKVAGSIYQKIVEETIADGRLSSDEKVFLEKVQRDLRLSEETAQRIYSEKAKEYLKSYLEAAISDERFSPKDEQEINAISESLGVNINYDEETKSRLNRYRLYWMIENENLKEIKIDIDLQRNEKCYFVCDVDWYEYKRVNMLVRYGAPMLIDLGTSYPGFLPDLCSELSQSS